MNEIEVRQESSIVTGARINIVTLAELAKWWENSGQRISTMSQLVSWSMDLLKATLVANEKIDKEEMSIVEANRYLLAKGLYQKSTRNKSFSKIATAIRFEGIREDGRNPQSEDPKSYNIVHNEKSVKPFKGEVKIVNDQEYIQLEGYPDGYMYRRGDEAQRDRLIEQLKIAGIKSVMERTEEAIAKAKEEGRIAIV